MGLLDHLWDDTVAGPRPDTGLGKLRKHPTFSFPSNSANEVESNMGGDDATRVTRRIMIVKPPQASQKDSPPVSPAGSTPPVSPFGGGGRFKRRSSFSFEKASGVGPRSPPPPYDL
ncbi:dormancy-associated protein homolog 3-like isoform X1 [Salvia hispanica]|uniref:dormancy-associated protein homolog 3-like isoform X1 n=1 Tax=Salvia hispanica TaxID=49212 RepID=UPI002009C2B5|nr:dormancy-associated protein homolog 3-like isoform X1 [Salvia hispanica]